MKDTAKTILCYGDSNTWGWNPSDESRYARSVRWPGVLQSELGEDYHVIEEGLSGRTTVWDDPIEGYRNGKEYLPPCLATHAPLDLVILLLGTNDLKERFSLPAVDIAAGAGVLVDIVKKSEAGPNDSPPETLLVCPPPLAPLEGLEFGELFSGAEAKSMKFAAHFADVAQEEGCHYLDASEVIVSSRSDGIHLEADEHRKLGRAVAGKVVEILG